MNQNDKRFDVEAFVMHRRVDIAILLAGVFLGIFLDWSVVEIAFFLVFIWSILGPISSRLLAFPALFFLLLTPALLVLDREARAEEFAVYAYYFLVMTVIRGIIEVRAEKDESVIHE